MPNRERRLSNPLAARSAAAAVTLADFIRSLPVSAAMFDRGMRYLAASSGWLASYGLVGQDLTGRSHYDVFPDLPERFKAIHRRGLAGETLRESHDRFPRADGTTQWLSWDMVPWWFGDGTVGGIVIFFEDRTEIEAAEEERRRVEGRYRALLDRAAPDPVLVHDARGRYVEVNERACETLGYSREELLRMTVMDVDSDLDEAGFMAALAAGRPGEERTVEVRPRRRDGTTFPARVRSVRVQYGGQPYYVSYLRDVTGETRAASALAASERRFRDIVEASADWVWEVDADGRYTFVSAGVEALLGYRPEELLGRTPFDLMPADEADRVGAEFARINAERRPVRELDKVNQTRDGRRRYIQTSGTPILDERGGLLGYRGLDRDVTASKLANMALRASEARYRDLFESNPNPMWVYDLETLRFLAVNDSAVRLYGYSREEFLRMTTVDVRPVPEMPRFREMLKEVDAASLNTGTWRHRRRDGSEVVVEALAHRIDFAGHDAVVVLLHDVTERMRVETEIRALNTSLERRVVERTAELRQANFAKSEFLANMSHELRSPLNAIIGFSEMMKDGVAGPLDAEQRGMAGDIFDAGTHLLEVINDILDLSKVEAGKLELEPEEFMIADLLESSLLVVRERARARSISLGVEGARDAGMIVADRRKLKQIVFNLLSNAVKFTPAGGTITIAARRCQPGAACFETEVPSRIYGELADGVEEYVVLSVIDTGIGIDQSKFDQLFQPFAQLGGAQASGGTGLGLSLVRRFAELHGGRVAVASSPGRGSRFCVWLPVRTVAKVHE